MILAYEKIKNVSPPAMVEALEELLGDQNNILLFVLELRWQTPIIYDGNINPEWKYWNNVVNYLLDNLKNDENHIRLTFQYVIEESESKF